MGGWFLFSWKIRLFAANERSDLWELIPRTQNPAATDEPAWLFRFTELDRCLLIHERLVANNGSPVLHSVLEQRRVATLSACYWFLRLYGLGNLLRQFDGGMENIIPFLCVIFLTIYFRLSLTYNRFLLYLEYLITFRICNIQLRACFSAKLSSSVTVPTAWFIMRALMLSRSTVNGYRNVAKLAYDMLFY